MHGKRISSLEEIAEWIRMIAQGLVDDPDQVTVSYEDIGTMVKFDIDTTDVQVRQLVGKGHATIGCIADLVSRRCFQVDRKLFVKIKRENNFYGFEEKQKEAGNGETAKT